MFRNLILPASILAGAVIGAGMFSLPFVFQAAGLFTGLFYLPALAAFLVLIYLIYADLNIRTPGDHRFVGFAKIYLGQPGFWLAILIGLIQMLFVLTIYLILAPSFSRLFVADNHLVHFLIFWALGSAAILFSTRRIAVAEFFITAGIILIIFLIFILGAPDFLQKGGNWLPFDLTKFMAVGPILFALAGSVAVPEVVSYFKETKTPLAYLRRVLLLGIVLPAALYFLFVIGVIGLSPLVTEDAVSGLAGQVPAGVLAAIGILGFLSLISSYIVIGLNVRRIFLYDLSLPKWLSGASVIFIPPTLYFLGFQNFIVLVTFLGGVFLPLESILILFMWLKANKQLVTPPILIGRWIEKIIPIILLVFFMVLIYVIIS